MEFLKFRHRKERIERRNRICNLWRRKSHGLNWTQLSEAVPYRLNWTRNLVRRNRTQLSEVVSYDLGRHSMSRKGNLGSGILYSVFFLMMVMIAMGIVGGTYAFFGKGYDFRASESSVLFYQVKTCFEKNNFFDSGFVEQPNLFYEKCRLSKEVLEDGEHLVYVKRISDGKEFFVGVYDYIVQCGLDVRLKNKDLPLCEPNVKTVGDYEFIVGSSQNSRRANS